MTETIKQYIYIAHHAMLITKNPTLEELAPHVCHHFKFSMEIIGLLTNLKENEDAREYVEQRLTEMFERLQQTIEIRVKNGWRYKKSERKKVQKWTKVAFRLGGKALIALHANDQYGNATHYHFHILMPQSVKRGENYVIVKNAIRHVCKEFGVVPHYDEINHLEPPRSEKAKMSRFTWAISGSSESDFIQFVQRKNFLKQLDSFYKYSKNTETSPITPR
ncbi:hypothetical protein [Hydrogenimonas urashimensis]|uniref:hypothetical protein n=1 Tax=Hydrogenimonas urashimensis TaxID=2740515 RepID=UPI001915ABCD|nr:hypothetical protein [Hydrogenimonas urashimensis]